VGSQLAIEDGPIMQKAQPVLRLAGAGKIYGGVYALDQVDFEVYPGEVHALIGENGAGKSTMAKLIAGAVPLSEGSLQFDGKEVHFHSPADSLRAGIAMVYQETSLVPTMTVAQNLMLGNERFFTSFAAIKSKAREHLQDLGFDVNPLARVEQLNAANRQMIEIARAIRQNARVIIFDEPTASLTPHETRHLFKLLNTLRTRGVAIIFISHALEDVLQMSDRVTILRDGKRVTSGPTSEFDRSSLIKLMVGRALKSANDEPSRLHPKRARGEEVISVNNVTAGKAVSGMSFSLYAGEVVGLAGLVGAGRSEIAKLVAGVFKSSSISEGQICLRGKAVRYRSPSAAIRDGIVYITEDRKIDGFFETMTAGENIYIASLKSRKGWSFFYRPLDRDKVANFWTRKLSIASLNRDAKIIEYSGGNQQKVVIAKSLAQEPDVIFFDEPTHGVDVGAIPQIHDAIRALANEGKAVVVISSYMPEILGISDRILVIRSGRVVEEFEASAATEDKIMLAAAL
jgi:simple sugar transport system ATP-binding protein/ribose transport system ATP-binding protein